MSARGWVGARTPRAAVMAALIATAWASSAWAWPMRSAAVDSAGEDSAAVLVQAPSLPPATLSPQGFGTTPGREVGHLGLAGRAGRGVANFGSDVWAVVSGPFRSPRSMIWTGAVLGVASVLYASDQEVLDATIRNRDAPVMKQVVDAGNKVEPVGLMGHTNPYYMGALAAGYALNLPVVRTVSLEILESHMIAGGIRNVGKILVGRHHPYDNQGPYAFTFAKGTSFPSGHTSVGYELATIATMNSHSVPVGIVGYSLATAMAVQRVESRNHWPSDVFLAGVYGTLVAHTVVKQHDMRERRDRTRYSYMVIPDVGDDGRLGVRVTTRF